MKRVSAILFPFCALLGTTFAHAQASPDKAGTSVWNGQKVAEGDAPWKAFIYQMTAGPNDGLHCGATIISQKWLLTAAHCFHNRNNSQIKISQFRIAIGTSKLSGDRQLVKFYQPIFADGFTWGDWDKDVALIRLDKPIPGVVPIFLATSNEDATPPPLYRVTGWGRTEKLKISDDLLYVLLKPVSAGDCSKVYPGRLTGRTLCAGDPPRDACTGDSGGPLFEGTGASAVQHGIVTAGFSCGKNPGVYARVSKHRGWIEATLKASGDQLAAHPSICTTAKQIKNEC